MGNNQKTCSGCAGCGSEGCSSCSGCGGGALLITPQELEILEQLRIYAFLPVARKADTMEPHCREEAMPEDCSLALQLLERKNLIRIDYDAPMVNFDYNAYQGLPVHGVISLTARGQEVLEVLEVLGVAEEEPQ